MSDQSLTARLYVGIDTSNYTTSTAVFDAAKQTLVSNVKRLLTVEDGERGLRQSDAVFAHVKNLPEVTREAFGNIVPESIRAIGVSAYPRDCEGSYMPCFLTGVAAASTLSEASKKPLYNFSHQAGHVMAAVWSSGLPDLLGREFLAFHVSGGTTELLLVKPGRELAFDIELVGGTNDLNAGQAIDRSGVKLGLGFPCGPALEALALANTEKIARDGVSVKGLDCSLSGVENRVERLIRDGKRREYIAAYIFDLIGRTLVKLTDNALEKFGSLPVLYAGGVMSNSIIKSMLARESVDARFAEPRLSSDNAAGVAILCAIREEGIGFWKK